MIDVLIPVLGRPERVRYVYDSILAASEWVDEIAFICTDGDGDEIDAVVEQTDATLIVLATDGHGEYSKKINEGYRRTGSPFVLLAADDLEFQDGWDAEALRVANDTDAGVIGTNDDGNPTVIKGKHSTHPLVSRDYIDTFGGTFDREPGVVLCELYGHQNTDTELVTLAKARRQFAFAAESHVTHLHPFWKKGEMDDVYRKGQASSRADALLYRKRLRMLRRIDP